MKTPTATKDATILRNLRGWLSLATPDDIEAGLSWYRDAMEYAKYLSVEFNVSRKVAAGVISALSPNNKWERNKIDAFTVLQAVRDGQDPGSVSVCTYGANKRKAFAIAMGNESILRKSPKTYAFAMNVGENSPDHVTVDKWHMSPRPLCSTAESSGSRHSSPDAGASRATNCKPSSGSPSKTTGKHEQEPERKPTTPRRNERSEIHRTGAHRNAQETVAQPQVFQ